MSAPKNNPPESARRPLASELLTGELTPAAVDALLERAERDPELSAELDLVADLTAAAELERERFTVASAAGPVRAAYRRLWITAAGALAAGLLAYWMAGLLQRSADQGPVDLTALADSPAPRFLESELRGSSAALKRELSEAMQSYVAGDFSAAEADLTAFLSAHPEHGSARLYRGVARIELGRVEAGLEDFGAVAAADDGFLGEHARWRAALAHLASGEPDAAAAARDLLEQLRSEDGSFAPNAVELLLELEQD